MSSLEILSTAAAGLVVLVMYTWFVIDVAATVALRRLEAMFAESAEEDDDIVNELDRMWQRRKRDE